MASFLVLESFSGLFQGSNWNFRSGEVIDDAHAPVAALQAMGLSASPYTSNMAGAVSAFDEQHGRDDKRPSILPALKARGVIPHMEEVEITPAMILAGSTVVSFPFDVSRFTVSILTAAGAPKFGGTDTFVITGGDIEITLPGGGGDIAATDVVTLVAVS